MGNESVCLARQDEQSTAYSLAADCDDDSAPAGFDYGSLDANSRAQVLAETRAIRRLISDDVSARIEIGRRLIALRGLVDRFEFQPLLKIEYGWSKSTTSNYMSVARVFPDLDADCLMCMHWSALVILSRDNIPEAARAEALALARSGVSVDKKLAEELVAEHSDLADSRDHAVLLKKFRSASRRTIRLLAALSASRAELSAEESDELDESVSDLLDALQSDQACPENAGWAVPTSPGDCGGHSPPSPVAEVARLRPSSDAVAEVARLQASSGIDRPKVYPDKLCSPAPAILFRPRISTERDDYITTASAEHRPLNAVPP